jgi:hypothetical protein
MVNKPTLIFAFLRIISNIFKINKMFSRKNVIFKYLKLNFIIIIIIKFHKNNIRT